MSNFSDFWNFIEYEGRIERWNNNVFDRRMKDIYLIIALIFFNTFPILIMQVEQQFEKNLYAFPFVFMTYIILAFECINIRTVRKILGSLKFSFKNIKYIMTHDIIQKTKDLNT